MAVSGAKLKTLPAVTVATAGTPVPIHDGELLVYEVIIISISSNTGTQYLGDSTVTSSNGCPLVPNGDISVKMPDMARGDQFNVGDIYVDSTTNGAEFRIMAWVRG